MEVKVLSIFHTSDIHGKFTKDKLIKIREILNECDTPKILVDSGDILKGGNIFFFPIEKTFYYINQLKYTAICMGNREFNYFRIILYSRLKKYPFLACNLIDKLNSNKYINSSLHLIINNFRITIIGLTKPQYPINSLWEKITAFRFEDNLQSVKNQIEKYYKITDLFIILSHLGIQSDIQLSENLYKEYPNLINKILILGGHDHKEFYSDQNIPIIHTEPYLKNLTHLELVFRTNLQKKFLQDIILRKIPLQ